MDFSRTNSFSRTFQGKPKIQGLFKDCGNPGQQDIHIVIMTTPNCRAQEDKIIIKIAGAQLQMNVHPRANKLLP